MCAIIIFAIVASVGVRYMGYIGHKQCLNELKSRLISTQSALSAYYAQRFLQADSIDTTKAYVILSRLEQNNRAKCAFYVHSGSIMAIVDSKNLQFVLEPASLVINPKISCLLKEALCKDFTDRILDK